MDCTSNNQTSKLLKKKKKTLGIKNGSNVKNSYKFLKISEYKIKKKYEYLSTFYCYFSINCLITLITKKLCYIYLKIIYYTINYNNFNLTHPL